MKIVIPVLLSALLASCGGDAPKRTEAASLPPVAVQTVEVRTVDWPVTHEVTGTVRARNAATVSARIMGYVREITAEPGSHVKAGQMIATIESRDLDATVSQAQAAEAEAQSGIAEADNGIAAAKAQLTLAQATFRRMDNLHRQASISDQEFDEASARLRTAEAALQMAQSKRAQLDARIAHARQGTASARAMQSYSRVDAPFSGVVTEKHAQAGQLATPGMPLLTIEQTGVFRLEAAVEESLLGTVRLGQKVRVALDAWDRVLDARVDEIVPAVDAQSRAFTVKASLPASPNLRSGVFGRLILDRGTQQSVVLPAGAIVERGELQSVFVADNGVARTRMVTVGTRRDGQAEVLSGLTPGERIISPRPANLVDGMKVEVR